MSWQKLILHAPSDQAEHLSHLLDEHGALSITFEANNEQELFEPPPGAMPLWDTTTITALFEADTSLQPIITNLQQAIHPQTLSFHTETLAEQNWQKNCTDAFTPILFGDRLWIYPSWHLPPDDGKARVELDPGLAFGTGAHATTALCLEWLTQNISAAETVIDYGCGSGILALAAIKLGAREVWAVDNDPQALEATQENAQRNQANLHTVLPEQLPHLQADHLVANILANPLISLAPHFAELVKPAGKIALSGILVEQIDAVSAAYQSWFDLNPPQIKDGWVCLSGSRYP
jgi:ribosomal protein L11 methyltransferase